MHPCLFKPAAYNARQCIASSGTGLNTGLNIFTGVTTIYLSPPHSRSPLMVSFQQKCQTSASNKPRMHPRLFKPATHKARQCIASGGTGLNTGLNIFTGITEVYLSPLPSRLPLSVSSNSNARLRSQIRPLMHPLLFKTVARKKHDDALPPVAWA